MLVCKICGKKFKGSRKSVKCCSDECRKIAKNNYDTVKNNMCICKICGKEFLSKRVHSKCCSDYCHKFRNHIFKNCIICKELFFGKKDTKTCSRTCNNILRKESNKIKLVCKNCNKTFERASAYVLRDKNVFCSNKCSNYNYIINNYGKSNKYSDGWYNLRLLVLEYYGNNCLCCGKKDEHMNIHHTIPRQFFKNKNLADNFEYLIPLCVQCHRKTHKENNQWFKENFTNIESNLLKKDIV